jgi:hypothetical protein
MKKMSKFLIALAVIASLASCEKKEVNPVTGEVKAVWSSCDKYAQWSADGYKLYNNVWGEGAGWQCIWANNGKNWGVSCNHGTSGGIKSYPNSEKWLNKTTNNTPWCGTWISVNRPNYGAYNTAFDVWANNKQYEIMIWVNKVGAIAPIGSQKYSNQSIGGHTWNVWRGWNGSIDVFSFVRTSNMDEGNIDHKAIWNWAQSKGWWNNPYVQNIQFGFEITNTGGSNASFTQNGRSDWNG